MIQKSFLDVILPQYYYYKELSFFRRSEEQHSSQQNAKYQRNIPHNFCKDCLWKLNLYPHLVSFLRNSIYSKGESSNFRSEKNLSIFQPFPSPSFLHKVTMMPARQGLLYAEHLSRNQRPVTNRRIGSLTLRNLMLKGRKTNNDQVSKQVKCSSK